MFCELIESANELGRAAFVWEVGARLARFYAAGHALPNEPVEGDLVDHEESESESKLLLERQRRLSDKLDDLDFYWGVHDPYDADGLSLEEVAEVLPDDLLEKYRDMFETGGREADGAVPEPVGHLLSDDLMDVYREVKAGLALFDSGQRESAVWEWRFGFQNHWGIDAVSALVAIHWLTHASGARSIAPDDP